jgi:hypothetical protein
MAHLVTIFVPTMLVLTNLGVASTISTASLVSRQVSEPGPAPTFDSGKCIGPKPEKFDRGDLCRISEGPYTGVGCVGRIMVR